MSKCPFILPLKKAVYEKGKPQQYYCVQDSRTIFTTPYSTDADYIIESVNSYKRLQAEVERLRKALVHIEEYWNRDQNETAMADALWEIINTAQDALNNEPKY